MAYRFKLWFEDDLANPVIDMKINSPNIDHARFVTRNLHKDYLANNYIPFTTKNTRSKLEYEKEVL